MKHKILTALVAIAVSPPAWAEIIVPIRTIKLGQVILGDNLKSSDQTISGAISEAGKLIGLEAKSVLYAGRPIHMGDVAPAALVERNQVVTLLFRSDVLNISTEGRALERGVEGDHVRVLNLSSRKTVLGRVDASGAIRVDG